MSLLLEYRRFRVRQARARLSHIKRILQRRIIAEGRSYTSDYERRHGERRAGERRGGERRAGERRAGERRHEPTEDNHEEGR